MASYGAATANLLADPGNVEGDIAAARACRYKYGLGLNWEQEMAKDIGVFSRLGWNDGHEETWTFTDVNWTASLGLSVNGEIWRRPDDTGLEGRLPFIFKAVIFLNRESKTAVAQLTVKADLLGIPFRFEPCNGLFLLDE